LNSEVTLNRSCSYVFSVEVPKSLFTDIGLTAGYVGVGIFGSIAGAKVYVRVGYNYTSDKWEETSFMVVFNGSTAGAPFIITGKSEDHTGDRYIVNITGYFTEAAPKGRYYCSAVLYDGEGNEFKISSLNWLPKNMFKAFRTIILEQVSGFTVSFEDENGNPIHYVRNGQLFRIKINATSPLTYAIFAIDTGTSYQEHKRWIVLKYDQGNFSVMEGYLFSARKPPTLVGG